MLEFVTITCPYCGEGFETNVDTSAGSTAYVEDCAVCCKPIEITLRLDENDGLIEVKARGGDE